MFRWIVTLSIASFACALVACDGDSGSGTGGGSCDPQCNGDKVGCSAVGSNLTALDALHAGKAAAQSILDATPVWMGAFAGIQITRDGTPTQEPTTSGGLKFYMSGWVFKFCAGMNDVGFGAGPQTSTAQYGCQDIDCSQVTVTAEPAIDSKAAIAAAFPSDSADTLYKVDFIPVLHGGQRVWTITNMTTQTTVNVDADTGVVVP